MLTTHLNSTPYSKFVVIEDSVKHTGRNVLDFLIDSHLKNGSCKVHHFSFENCVKQNESNITYYDFVSDPKGWFEVSNNKHLESELLKINEQNSIVIFDSLSHAIFQYDLISIYKAIQKLLQKKGILRIVALLHQDLLENPIDTIQYFQHLSTLYISLELETDRLLYIYKKPSGKVIKQIEYYKFENRILKMEPIKKLNLKQIVKESLNQALPKNLTTFKISLDDQEKESRNNLILPYTQKKVSDKENSEGTILYEFDNVDDWDEEDPDDDLDI